MAGYKKRFSATRASGAAAAGILLVTLSGGALAQDNLPDPSGQLLEKLKTCQAIEEPNERLACFDASVGEIVAASEAGEVRIIDREDVRQTRRALFGLSVPDVGVLKSDEDKTEEGKEARELLETTITSVRYRSARKIRFTTQEGAIWEINNAPRRLRTIEPGNSVIFKKASLGYFFIRIEGQLGVKGRRVQ